MICSEVVRMPKECTGCGNLFCAKCIDEWRTRNKSCPNRCNGQINFMTSRALIKIYNDLDIKCKNAACSAVVKLIDLPKHEEECGKQVCWNSGVCSGYERKEFSEKAPCCSDRCLVLNELLGTKGNVKEMFRIMTKFVPRPESQADVVLRWIKYGNGVALDRNGMAVFLKETAYVFRTAIANRGFSEGKHYWELIADDRTENELKVGVACSNNFDFNTAFCDHSFGFAFYGLGQLRHNSNASGIQFGRRWKKTGVLGIYLNMIEGKLWFSLNGESMGLAFTDPMLKKGPIYPAVSLLHCAGCIIRGELPIPEIFQNEK